MDITRLDPENVRKVQSFVRWLLQGLDLLPEYDRINLLEQATALEQLASEFRQIAAGRNLAIEMNEAAKNLID
jgi:hypothetical protein